MRSLLIVALLAIGISAQAAIGLTTVPDRDTVRLTIYNAVDLTLVQESRELVLKQGLNRIQYQWQGTLIDTTSLRLRPLGHKDAVSVGTLIYPPGAPATLVWEVESDIEGSVPFEISYFTSGLSWSADYVLRTSPDESEADVIGTVMVTNHSGESYEGAEVRLVVGTINLVESIRDLATGQMRERRRPAPMPTAGRAEAGEYAMALAAMDGVPAPAMETAPEVESVRLADYHIFGIGGRQTVADGASTRFVAIETEEPLDLELLYRVDLGRDLAHKLFRFINDDGHHLPDGPLPDGRWNVFRVTDPASGAVSYLGSTHSAYIPPDQKVELGMGVDPAISVEQHDLWRRQTDFHFNANGFVDGWIEHLAYSLRIINNKPIPISLEYQIPTGGGDWSIAGIEGERRDQGSYRMRREIAANEMFYLPSVIMSHRHGKLSRDFDHDHLRPINPPEQHELPAVETTP